MHLSIMEGRLAHRAPTHQEETRTQPPGSGRWDAQALLQYVTTFASREATHVSLCVATSALQQLIERHVTHRSAVAALRLQLQSVGDRLASDGWLVGYYGKEVIAVRAEWVATLGSSASAPTVRPDCCTPEVLPGLPKLDEWLTEELETAFGWSLGCLNVFPRHIIGALPDLRTDVRLQATVFELTAAAKQVRNSASAPDCRLGRNILRSALRESGTSPMDAAATVTSLFTTPPLTPDNESRDPADRRGRPLKDSHFSELSAEFDMTLADLLGHRESDFFLMTDVHDIEHGVTLSLLGSDGRAVPPGNPPAVRSVGTHGWLLPAVLEFALDDRAEIDDLIITAFSRRQQASQWLVTYYRQFQILVPQGKLFAATGDGLFGRVPRRTDLARVSAQASRRIGNTITSGAGATEIQQQDSMVTLERRAAFSLHVTKLFKGTGHHLEYAHVFGQQLSHDAESHLVRRLSELARDSHRHGPRDAKLARAVRMHRQDWRGHMSRAGVLDEDIFNDPDAKSRRCDPKTLE